MKARSEQSAQPPHAQSYRKLWRLLGAVTILALDIGVFARHAHSAPSPSNGPVRLARFVDVQGDVDWRRDSRSGWSRAARNLPVRQGAEIAAHGNGRAELQFDDGSMLRIGNGAVVTLSNLYSDQDGEYTELTQRTGSLGIELTKAPSVYQVDTPLCTVDSSGPARLRVDCRTGVQVAVREGTAVCQGPDEKASLTSGSYLDLRNERDPYSLRSLPPADNFDNWTEAGYTTGVRRARSPHRSYVPSNIAVVADDLDDYGDWRDDPKYGHVWCPRVHSASWRPYHDGRWVWSDPFGWTWVADEPWGWAPYHYGTWIHEGYGWAWCPGTRRQYWSPAVVNYCRSGSDVAWCPLAPTEVRYPPTLSVGFRSGDWSLFFSIGGAAVYYPTRYGYYDPVAWSPAYANRVTYVNNVTTINNYYGPGFAGNRNTYIVNRGYVPANARFGGASYASGNGFAARGGYRPLDRSRIGFYQRGQYVAAPGNRSAPAAGPASWRPSAATLTATRQIRNADPVARAAFRRTVFRPAGGASGPVGARAIIARPPAGVAANRRGAPARQRPGAIPGTRPNSFGAAPFNRPAQGQSGRPGFAGSTNRPQVRPAQTPLPAAHMSPAQQAAIRARGAVGIQRPSAMRTNAPRGGAAQHGGAPAIGAPRNAHNVNPSGPAAAAQQARNRMNHAFGRPVGAQQNPARTPFQRPQARIQNPGPRGAVAHNPGQPGAMNHPQARAHDAPIHVQPARMRVPGSVNRPAVSHAPVHQPQYQRPVFHAQRPAAPRNVPTTHVQPRQPQYQRAPQYQRPAFHTQRPAAPRNVPMTHVQPRQPQYQRAPQYQRPAFHAQRPAAPRNVPTTHVQPRQPQYQRPVFHAQRPAPQTYAPRPQIQRPPQPNRQASPPPRPVQQPHGGGGPPRGGGGGPRGNGGGRDHRNGRG